MAANYALKITFLNMELLKSCVKLIASHSQSQANVFISNIAHLY